MKLNNIKLYIVIFGFVSAQFFAQNTNPVVSNVSFTIVSTTATVTYDVTDTEDNSFTVYMEVSENSGADWNFNYGSASGDIGLNVTEGTNKTITWTYNGSNSGTMKIKILADDLYGDQIYYSYKIYNTVTIGGQTWLKENLDLGTMINGAFTQFNNGILEKFCYNNDANNCTNYGALYQWNEAMRYVTAEGSQGICPNGWRIPAYAELQALSGAVGGDGNALKAIGQGSGDYAGTNTSGFSALLAGYRSNGSGSFYQLANTGYFWSSTENSSNAYYMRLFSYASSVGLGIVDKYYAYSIRCLKN